MDVDKDTLCVVGDVSKQENVNELFEKIKGKFGEEFFSLFTTRALFGAVEVFLEEMCDSAR